MSAARPAAIAMMLLVAATGGSAARAAAASAPGQPAVWTAHTIIVHMHDLPKVYSCKDLWYRFHAVLVKIGARPDTINVLAYDCETRSPNVQLEFAFPRALQPSQAQLADLRIAERPVTLEPGQPAPLDTGDCKLMRQITEGFLPELPVQVVSSSLECGSRRFGERAFQVSLQAPEPIEREQPKVAARDGAGAVSPPRKE